MSMSTTSEDKKSTSSSWNLALKQWNSTNENKILGKSGKPKFIIPKKNTPEFEIVKKISDEIKASQPPKVRKTSAREAKNTEIIDGSIPPVQKEKKPRKNKDKIIDHAVNLQSQPVQPVQSVQPVEEKPDLDMILNLLKSMKN